VLPIYFAGLMPNPKDLIKAIEIKWNFQKRRTQSPQNSLPWKNKPTLKPPMGGFINAWREFFLSDVEQNKHLKKHCF
jgi:hypothetical protein